jgi:hypothetical protein
LIYKHFSSAIVLLERVVCTAFYAMTRRFFRHFEASVHTERTRVATVTKPKSGSRRVQVQRKGKYVNETFLRRIDAEEWGIDIERRIGRQEPATTRKSRDVQFFGDRGPQSKSRIRSFGNDTNLSRSRVPKQRVWGRTRSDTRSIAPHLAYHNR